MTPLKLYLLLVVKLKKSPLQPNQKGKKTPNQPHHPLTLAISAVSLTRIIEHKKVVKEPMIAIVSGHSIGPLVGPVNTPEIRMKALKISDTFEHSKEIQTLFRAFHEIWRTLRQRAVDIALLRGIVDGSNLIPKEQTMDDVVNKIIASETARVKIENKKIELLAVFYVEERETKK